MWIFTLGSCLNYFFYFIGCFQFDADSCFQLVADRSAQAMLEMIAAGGVQSDEINPTQNSPLATPNRLRSVSFPTDPDCFNLPSGTQSSSPTTPGGSNIYAWRSTGAPANLPYANIPRTIGGGSYVIRNSPATYAQSPTAQTTVESGRVQQQQPTAARVGVKKHANLHLIVQGSNDSDADGQFSPSVYISNGSLGTPNIRLTPSSPSVTFVNAQRVSGGTSRSSSSSRSPYDAPEVSRAVPNSPWLHRRPDLLADFPSSSATTSSSVDSSPTSPLNRLPFGRPMGFNSGSSPSLNIDESSNERPNSVNSRGPIRLQTSSSCIFNHSDQLNGLTVITGRSRTQQSPLSVVLSPANDRRMSYPDLIASPVRTVERSPFATQPNQEVTNIRKYSQPLSIHVESDSSTPPARPVADRSFKGFSISLGMPNRTTSPLATTSPQSGQQLHQPLMKPTQLSFQPGSVQQMNPTAFSFQNSNFSHDNDQPMAPSDDYIRCEWRNSLILLFL